MRQQQRQVLPIGFYDSKGWCKSIIGHYADDEFSPDTLRFPVEALTIGIGNIINVYGNHPKDVVKLIKQAVNPLYTPEEYKERIYKVIKQAAIKSKDPYVDMVAESLYYMRLLFEKDRNYIKDHFSDEIKRVGRDNETEKLEYLADELSSIVRTHARQVAGMITEHCGMTQPLH